MNNKDVKKLIEEWSRNPPGSRPLLEKAIAEQYRKALTSQWEGLKIDGLTQWLRSHLPDTTSLSDSKQDALDSRIAAILDEAETVHEQPGSALPLAAFKPSAKQQKASSDDHVPNDDEIRLQVYKILKSL